MVVVDKNNSLDKTGKTMLDNSLHTTAAIISHYAILLLGKKEYAVIDQMAVEYLKQHPSFELHWVVENNDNGHRPLDVCGQPLPTLGPGHFRLWDASYYNLVGNARRAAAEQLEAKLREQASTRSSAAEALSKATGISLDLATIALKTLSQDALKNILDQASKLQAPSTPSSANI